MALFGWRGAYLVPALAVAVATLCTAFWLRATGRSPLFALMVLGYPPVLVLGRVAMSDLPSTALAALGLWLFWTGGTDRRGRWLASGFIAGLSLSFRETNALLFALLYLGALIRRENGLGALVAGGIAGSLLRPLLTAIVFGDPFYAFPTPFTFELSHVIANLPIYALALLVFVPGSLIGALLYRGARWPEVVVTVAIFCGVYLSYGYRGEESGLVKGLILGPRYFAPLIPLAGVRRRRDLPTPLGSLSHAAQCKRNWPNRRRAGSALRPTLGDRRDGPGFHRAPGFCRPLRLLGALPRGDLQS